MKHTFTSIGTIQTEHLEKEGTPIQSAFAKNEKGVAVLDEEFMPGLKDLQDFSHIILIYVFDRHDDYQLEVKPYLDDTLHGVFATRAPKRPNQIGLSVVQLLNINENRVEFLGADMLNDSPLLDIKPYVPDFDNPGEVLVGWYKNNMDKKNKKADNRF